MAQSRLLPIPGLMPAAVKQEGRQEPSRYCLSGLRKEA